ncbi:cold-shock protein [Rhodanobacter sp. FW106-PBR-R2A-1-13]|uniref:cold-shock protein n=1 Tax=Rhodanobacter sp. FW106-PBR-R2A-1-13 TaxID=3454845 RepID=UPI0034E431C3
MQGQIRTYLPDQGYGFIHGDDGRDYYFRREAFAAPPPPTRLAEAVLVAFEPRATPRGYRAERLVLVDAAQVTTFLVPDDVVTSGDGRVKGWEVLERGDWIVHGTSKDSPETARRLQRQHARQLGANALLDVAYYKTTGRRGTPSGGIYRFTIHHVQGRAAVVGRRDRRGAENEADLRGLDERARRTKQWLKEETRKARRRRLRQRLGLAVAGASVALVPYLVHGLTGAANGGWGILAPIGGLVVFYALASLIFGTAPAIDWLEYRPWVEVAGEVRMRASR